MQQRLSRFVRQPEKFESRQLTDKALETIAVIERYRFISSSLLVRLVEGGQRNTYRHLQSLFHQGLVSRFALPTTWGTPGEFVYYLDRLAALRLLTDRGVISPGPEELERKEELVRLNRQKAYHQLHKDPNQQGKLLYIQHELMISRFHALLELACRKFAGKVVLEQWRQGAELWNRVELPAVRKLEGDNWQELSETEFLPHRPDAFFTLRFEGNPPGKDRSHFLYEADRGTENTTRFKLKLRAHFHYIVKQQRQRTESCYGVHGIRAVLIESTDMHWAHNLRLAARHPIVSPKPSPLFWFTTSEVLTKLVPATGRQIPLYLEQPEVIFRRIWASTVEDTFLNLAD